jgi:hypothetical protein
MPGMWNMVSEMFVGGPYEHRGSSSLTPGQTMLREDFTAWIYYFFDRALEYLMGMVQIQSEFTRLRLFVCQWGK